MSSVMMTKGSWNIFSDLGFGPVEAQNLLLRAQLRSALMIWYKESGLKQAPAAKQLGITQPLFNQLLKGKIKDFSLDALVNLAGAAGLQLKLNVEPSPKTKANTTPKRNPSIDKTKIPMKKTIKTV